MSSKGWPKDGDKVMKLTAEEVRAIENGATNVNFMTNKSIHQRLYQTIWELHNFLVNNDNPSGNSVAQRLEYWRVSWKLFLQNPFIGVGRGDLVDELRKSYIKMDSKLLEEHYNKPHNQYLTTLVSYGIVGFLAFLFVLGYAFRTVTKTHLGLMFLVIATISMITEDTLETQIGVSFFAVFFYLFTFLGNSDFLKSLLGKSNS